MGTKEVLIVGGVGVGILLFMRSDYAKLLGLGVRHPSVLSGVRNAAEDASGIVDAAKHMFDTGKSIWDSVSGFFDTTDDLKGTNFDVGNIASELF